MPGYRLPGTILEWEPEGTRRKESPEERWMDGEERNVIDDKLTEEDTIDRDMWRYLVLGKRNPLYGGHIHECVNTLSLHL